MNASSAPASLAIRRVWARKNVIDLIPIASSTDPIVMFW
eukprot:COSAG02_NODE_5289_length_4469_cov_2.041876_2_plen_39_part_00